MSGDLRRIEALIVVLLAAVVLILSPGAAVDAIIAVVALVGCLVSLWLSRRGAGRNRAAPRPRPGAPRR